MEYVKSILLKIIDNILIGAAMYGYAHMGIVYPYITDTDVENIKNTLP